MAVIGSLVLGADGSSTLGGNSQLISNPLDQERFLARRRLCNAILIGGNTARLEAYQRTPVPVVVLSHTRPPLLDQNPKAHWWNLSPTEAVERAVREFGERLSAESGVSLLTDLLDANLITELNLTITPKVGGEKKMDYKTLLAHFENIQTEEIDGTIFYTCTSPITLQK